MEKWIERCPPKAEVRGSNPLECANLFNKLAGYANCYLAHCYDDVQSGTV